MINRKKASNYTGDNNRIKTDRPLCEKDEQGEAIERMRKYQNQALKLWRSFIQKKTGSNADYVEG